MSISDEIGLAFRDQNWGEKQIELRGLLGKTCLMLGSELRGQMVRFAGQRWENHQNRESQRLVRMRPAQGNWSGFEFRFVKTKAGNVSVESLVWSAVLSCLYLVGRQNAKESSRKGAMGTDL